MLLDSWQLLKGLLLLLRGTAHSPEAWKRRCAQPQVIEGSCALEWHHLLTDKPNTSTCISLSWRRCWTTSGQSEKKPNEGRWRSAWCEKVSSLRVGDGNPWCHGGACAGGSEGTPRLHLGPACRVRRSLAEGVGQLMEDGLRAGEADAPAVQVVRARLCNPFQGRIQTAPLLCIGRATSLCRVRDLRTGQRSSVLEGPSVTEASLNAKSMLDDCLVTPDFSR